MSLSRQPISPARGERCRGETLAGTNGDGLAVLICIRCGGREVVFPRRVVGQ
jgi:hypothetical protein